MKKLMKKLYNLISDKGVFGLIKTFWSILGEYIKKEILIIIAALIFSILSAVCALLAPYLISVIIDEVLPEKNMSMFIEYIIYLLLTFLAFFILCSIHIRYAVKSSENIFFNLKERLITTLLNKPVSFYQKYNLAELVTRVSNDLDFLSNFFYNKVFKTFVDDLFSGVIIVFIFYLNWQLGLFAIVIIPLYILFLSYFDKPISKRALLTKKKLTEQNNIIIDIVSGYKEIRFFQQKNIMLNRFINAVKNFKKASIKELIFKDMVLNGINAINILFTLSPIIFGGLLICLGRSEITIGLLFAYYTYYMYLTEKLFSVAEGYTSLSQAIPSLNRINEILDYQEEKIIKTFDIKNIPDNLNIIFQNVSFKYSPDKYILNNLNFTISSGEKAAIFGSSGKGKTTLLNLLLRFIEPSEGKILLGDTDIRNYKLESYLSYFSYVSQNTYLFNMSIKNNIAMGWYNLPFDEIKKAAKIVNIDTVIESLPNKYDTIINPKDFNLSGGQYQRIVLARALVREPAILVLDEFTSALDKKNEEIILNEIFNIFDKQTIICISHSNEVINRFEKIIEL